MYTVIVLVVLVVMFLASAIRILNEYERAVIFRLGRVIATKGPGLIILIPVVDTSSPGTTSRSRSMPSSISGS
jgi:regulator of protease activity HflC (stomatin/prohibitin superfamily)